MDSAPMNSIKYECRGKNNYAYSVQIKQSQSKIDFLVQDKNSITSGNFKMSLSLEELQKLNKYYKQYDSIEEAYLDIVNMKNINELTSIETDKNFIKFSLTIPNVSQTCQNKSVELMMKNEETSENDILFRLCEKVKEIDVLKRKNDYLFYVLGKTEKDFENYEHAKELFPYLTGNLDNSTIIKYDNLVVVQQGLLKKLNKKIKDIKFLYSASKDGDSANIFHSKCDGIPNTVTFVKTRNGRMFGGFTEKGWNSYGQYYIDNNAFLFSLDTYECYYYKKGKCLYGYPSSGPIWGSGYDLYLADKCLSENSSQSKQTNDFEYNGKMNCLSGGELFQPADYETYQLFLE